MYSDILELPDATSAKQRREASSRPDCLSEIALHVASRVAFEAEEGAFQCLGIRGVLPYLKFMHCIYPCSRLPWPSDTACLFAPQ